ncbi:putative hemolysin [Halomonas caseinilytica]
MANPASVYCEEQGGTLEIKQNADGQYGMCALPDGTQIEEWDLYRRDHPSK